MRSCLIPPSYTQEPLTVNEGRAICVMKIKEVRVQLGLLGNLSWTEMTVGDNSWIFFYTGSANSKNTIEEISSVLLFGVWPVLVPVILWGSVFKSCQEGAGEMTQCTDSCFRGFGFRSCT